MDLKFIKVITSYDDLEEDQLKKYCESIAEFSKDVTAIDMPDKNVERF